MRRLDARGRSMGPDGARLHGDARRGDADDADVPLRPDPDRALRRRRTGLRLRHPEPAGRRLSHGWHRTPRRCAGAPRVARPRDAPSRRLLQRRRATRRQDQPDVRVPGESLKPAYPVWLDVRACSLDPIFDVPGVGRPGSTFSVSTTVPAPFTGRIVAALGHLHGGGKSDVLTEPACGDREVLRSTPSWGGPRSLPYRVRPLLHEPSPVGMSTITSEQGFPVQAGEPLKLTANYDDQLPHTRVMGIMGLYITPDPAAPARAPLPTDIHVQRTAGPAMPPRFRVPIHGIA